MSVITTSQVNLIAVGVESYDFMPPLRGPQKDVERFVDLIVHSPKTGLYSSSQIKTLINPDSNKLRACINDYVINRSALGDVLIFYFSGHGIPVGYSDFGFCTLDARVHNVTEAVLPLTVLRFRDLIDSLRIMSITPVIIIDACYSGIAGSALDISYTEAIGNMQREITKQNATNYALLCSCEDRQVSFGNSSGGVFSQAIFDLLQEGFATRKPDETVVYLQDVFPSLSNRVNSIFADSTPQLFLGETIPNIPLVKNVGFTPQRYRFQRYMGAVVASLWNNGNEREFSKDEILANIGRGAYGNHRKLSFSGWSLVEDNPENGKRRLTDRGRQFAQGKLLIPDEVIFDPSSKDYVASPDAERVDINTVLGI